VYPLVDALSVKQENGLDVPPSGHWWAVNIHTYIPQVVEEAEDLQVPLSTREPLQTLKISQASLSHLQDILCTMKRTCT